MLQLREPELLLPLPGLLRVHRRRQTHHRHPAGTRSAAPAPRSNCPTAAGITGTVTAPTERAATAIRAALSWLGTPYAWGGGNAQGPTLGIRDGCTGLCQVYQDWTITGFDCSGLTLYAWAQAGVALSHGSYDQVNQGHQLPYAQALPGDLLFWGGAEIHHVALYLGPIDGRHYMVEAPQSGDHVKVSVVRTGGDFNNIAVRL